MVRVSHPLVYQPKLAFDVRRRIRVGSRRWYGDMAEWPINLPRWREPSILDEIVEQPRLEWLQRRLLVAEELGLGLAHLAALLRVAVEGVVGDFLTPSFLQIGGELVCIKTRAFVIDEVLQVVGVPVLLRRAQQDDSLADEDAALGLLRLVFGFLEEAVVDDGAVLDEDDGVGLWGCRRGGCPRSEHLTPCRSGEGLFP